MRVRTSTWHSLNYLKALRTLYPRPLCHRPIRLVILVFLAVFGASAEVRGSLLLQGVGAGLPTDTIQARIASPLLSDLAIRFGARGEFGGDWALYRPCDISFRVTCRPGLIPQLQPDFRFELDALGSVASRFFVDVDYDQAREFGGANRFRVYYQGREGELLQRIEIGDVSVAFPDTRFLTRSVPAGNFGVLLEGAAGGVEVRTIFAQQQGARRTRDFLLGGLGSEAGVIYRDTLVLDDAAYVKGQFFFLVDPEGIVGNPHIDILSLRPGDAPPSLAPGGLPIQLYRMERDLLLQQQVEGFIRADAEAEGEGEVIRESGWFRYLRPGEDYYQHPSGLWIALRVPLRPGDALAVTYVSNDGSPIGDYNPEILHNVGQIPTLRLLRSTLARHQPDRPTWPMEIKQVYRVSGSNDVERTSLDLSISLGEASAGNTFRSTPWGNAISFLRLFGVDETAPGEKVDQATIFQPYHEALDLGGVQGTYLVFPTRHPFLEPPPVPSAGLSAEQAASLLGSDVNRGIYEALDPIERESGGLYRLNLSAEIRSSGVGSVFSLGAFGLRRGSERIYLGDRLLRPEVDYVIDPEGGIVTLLQPEVLLLRASSDRLRVSWEEVSLFQEAPTSLLGVNTRIPFGTAGALDLIGLFQVESRTVNRPRFGAEPATMGTIGATSRLAFPLSGVDRTLDRLFPGRRTEASALRVGGEFAVSIPDPNRSGDAFLDDFDAGDERAVSLLSTAWHLGSAPAYRTGAENRLPEVLDERSAASLVWQHSWIERGSTGDSIGIFEGLLPGEIDRQIRVAGTQFREQGLRLAFDRSPGITPPGLRWRSITTLLSPSGADLTYTEYLDFYVADGDSITLIFDLGMVSEDAFFLNSRGETSGAHPITGRPWGLGVLDQEADPLRGEIWSPTTDERGVWAEECVAEPGRVYLPGDPVANCTAGNGRRDTEDLNGNGVLDSTERYVRYVVRLDGTSPFLVRNRTATGTPFRLFRIPLRGAHALTPSGAFTEADWRAIQFLRVTVAGSRGSALTLARMRLVGSRWVKRRVDGVLSGIGGDEVATGGRLEISPVSTVSEGNAYQPPPGVLEQLDDPTSAISGRGVEFNEKSLALRYSGLSGGNRGEVYYRFLQRPRNFLSYGELRFWAVAREGTQGGTPTDFFLKVGSDPGNFYLYRFPLEPVPDPGGVLPQDWLPERVVHFDQWIELRRVAEQLLLTRPPFPGAPPVEVWSTDSTYAVVLEDRARAPNLAAVREISLGVWNPSGALPADGEVWVNELRLSSGERTMGTARDLSFELQGGGLLDFRFDYTGTGPHFQQLQEAPTYQGDNEIALSAAAHLGAVAPVEWGWSVPLSVSYRSSDRSPFLLEGTDLRGADLPGLRTSGSQETRLSVAFRQEGETGNRLIDGVLGGVDARFSLIDLRATFLTTESQVSEVVGSLGYRWRPASRTVPLIPSILEPIARIFIPGDFLRWLREVDLRWTPEEIFLRNGIRNRDLALDRFDNILINPSGILTTPRENVLESWLEQEGRISFRPATNLFFSADIRTSRDLLDPEVGILDPLLRPAVEEERRTLFGTELGWEVRREVVTRVTFRPSLPNWARGDLGVQTRYLGDRDPGFSRRHLSTDSVRGLLRTAGGERDLRMTLALDPELLAGELRRTGSDGTPQANILLDGIGRLLAPVTLSMQSGIVSRYQREGIDPNGLFQLGWGSTGSFREVDGVAATSLADRRDFSAGSGLRFPGTLVLNANYRTTRVVALDARSERENRVTTWPDLRIAMTNTPVPYYWRSALDRVSWSVGAQRTVQRTDFGGAVSQRWSRGDRRIPMEVALEWSSGLVTRYRGQVGWGSGLDPTGETERKTMDHGLSVETRATPGRGMAIRGEPMRLSLLLSYTSSVECRIVIGRSLCVDFIDQVNRGASLVVDTRVQGIEVGGQVGIVDRRSFTGAQLGFTQFQLGVWGRMLFEAGPIGRLTGNRRDPF